MFDDTHKFSHTTHNVYSFTHATHAVCEVGTTTTKTDWEVYAYNNDNSFFNRSTDPANELVYTMEAIGSDGRVYQDLLFIDKKPIYKEAHRLGQYVDGVIHRLEYIEAKINSGKREALQEAFAIWCKNNLEEKDPEQFFMNATN